MSGMLPWSGALAGRLDEHVIDSVLLRDNPLGDPASRPLWVYVPPGYDGASRRYPSVYVIQGYTGHLAMWRNRNPYRQPFLETADAVFASHTPTQVDALRENLVTGFQYAFHLIGVAFIEHQNRVNIAIARVKHVADAEPVLLGRRNDMLHDLRQLRARNDAVLRAVTRIPEPADGAERLLAGLP